MAGIRDTGITEVEAIRLDKLRYAVRRAFDGQILAEIELDSWPEVMFDQMIYQLRAEILAEKIAEAEVKVSFERTVYFNYPATWWQHFKDAWNVLVLRHGGWIPRGIAFHMIRNVRNATVTKTVSETQRVRTAQFAAFPAASIRTPKDFHGPLLVRKEQVDTYA